MNNINSISVIVPLYNEGESLPALVNEIIAVVDILDLNYELILINDGSRDNTLDIAYSYAKNNKLIKVINFRRNYGQTAAIMAGIRHSKGDVIIPMDGDLQNDPKDIPALLAKINEGFDVVSGWRKFRKDNSFTRNFPSKVANLLISYISKIKLNDYGCTLKAYRREFIENIKLYGEMHRFIPIYASWEGAKVVEIAVNHRQREFGASKYGLERVFKVLLDLIVIKFMAKYAKNPIYFFGGIGIFFMLIAFLSGIYALILKFIYGESLISTPLPVFISICFMAFFISVMLGIISEMNMRAYYESQDKSAYIIKDDVNIDIKN